VRSAVHMKLLQDVFPFLQQPAAVAWRRASACSASTRA
jgi:hypothetical protein